MKLPKPNTHSDLVNRWAGQNYDQHVEEHKGRESSMWETAAREMELASKFTARIQSSLDKKWDAAFSSVKWYSNLGIHLNLLGVCVFLNMKSSSKYLRSRIKKIPKYLEIENKFWKDNGTQVCQEFVEYD